MIAINIATGPSAVNGEIQVQASEIVLLDGQQYTRAAEAWREFCEPLDDPGLAAGYVLGPNDPDKPKRPLPRLASLPPMAPVPAPSLRTAPQAAEIVFPKRKRNRPRRRKPRTAEQRVRLRERQRARANEKGWDARLTRILELLPLQPNCGVCRRPLKLIGSRARFPVMTAGQDRLVCHTCVQRAQALADVAILQADMIESSPVEAPTPQPTPRAEKKQKRRKSDAELVAMFEVIHNARRPITLRRSNVVRPADSSDFGEGLLIEEIGGAS